MFLFFIRRHNRVKVLSFVGDGLVIFPGLAGKSSLGYLFGYAGDDEHPFVWYDFRASRSREGPCEVLAGYRGFLQTDVYSAYESLVASYTLNRKVGPRRSAPQPPGHGPSATPT